MASGWLWDGIHPYLGGPEALKFPYLSGPGRKKSRIWADRNPRGTLWHKGSGTPLRERNVLRDRYF